MSFGHKEFQHYIVENIKKKNKLKLTDVGSLKLNLYLRKTFNWVNRNDLGDIRLSHHMEIEVHKT